MIVENDCVHFSYDRTNVYDGPRATFCHDRHNDFANAKNGKCVGIEYMFDVVERMLDQGSYVPERIGISSSMNTSVRTWSRKSRIVDYNVNLTLLLQNMIQSILNTFIACNIKRNFFNRPITKICNGFGLP